MWKPLYTLASVFEGVAIGIAFICGGFYWINSIGLALAISIVITTNLFFGLIASALRTISDRKGEI